MAMRESSANIVSLTFRRMVGPRVYTVVAQKRWSNVTWDEMDVQSISAWHFTPLWPLSRAVPPRPRPFGPGAVPSGNHDRSGLALSQGSDSEPQSA